MVARVASPGQDDRNSRGDGPTFAALRRLRLRNWPTPLAKPNWSETPSLDYAASCLGLPWSPQIRPSFRYVPSAGTQIRWLRADATVPERFQQTRQKVEHRLRGGVGMQECFRDGTQHTLSVRSFLPHKFFSCRQLPVPGPFGTEFMSDNVPLCAIPLLHCHADCYSAPSRSCGQSVRQFAGILHANAAATPVMRTAGSACPKPPPILIARLLPSPRRLR